MKFEQAKKAGAVAKVPKFIYRYLNDAEHAHDFCQGRIWLSTLDEIRDPNHPRSDVQEATSEYVVTDLGPHTPSGQAALIQEHIKGFISGEVRIQDVAFRTSVANAFVLCTSIQNSKRMRNRFGQHCVRIADPAGFLQAVAEALYDVVPILNASADFMQYDGRSGGDGYTPVANPMLSNVPGNSDEREYRLWWNPETHVKHISPLKLNAPILSRFCSVASLG